MRLNITIPDKYVPALQVAADEAQRSLSGYIVAVVTGQQRLLNVSTSVVSDEREVIPTTSSPNVATTPAAPSTPTRKWPKGEGDDDPFVFVESTQPHNSETEMVRRCRRGEFKTWGELRAAIREEKLGFRRELEADVAKQAAYRKYRRDEEVAARLQKDEERERTTDAERATLRGASDFGFNKETGEWDVPLEHEPTCGCKKCQPELAASYLRKVIAYHRERLSEGLPIYDANGMRYTTEQVMSERYDPRRDQSPTPPSYPSPQEISLAEDITNVPSASLDAALAERAAIEERERRKEFRVVKA